MQAFSKIALVAALGLSAFGALAGEISNTTIDASGSVNTVGSDRAYASQIIGSTYGTGRITNSNIYARRASNDSFGRDGAANQRIGVAEGGTMDNVTVYADRARNRTANPGAQADQFIGTVKNGTMSNVTVIANDVFNDVRKTDGTSRQKIGTVN